MQNRAYIRTEGITRTSRLSIKIISLLYIYDKTILPSQAMVASFVTHRRSQYIGKRFSVQNSGAFAHRHAFTSLILDSHFFRLSQISLSHRLLCIAELHLAYWLNIIAPAFVLSLFLSRFADVQRDSDARYFKIRLFSHNVIGAN